MTRNEVLVKNELDKYFGLNVCAVFGILGNIKAESDCRGNNLQNSYEKKLGFTDEEYTSAIDHMDYDRDDFTYDRAGYGLCQWTYWSRKQALYDYWIKYYPSLSISYIPMQVAFLNTEISNKLHDKLMACKTVGEATRIFMLEFEKPANQSKENIERRINIAQDLYLDWQKSNCSNTCSMSLKPEEKMSEETKELVNKALDFYASCASSFVSYDEIIELQVQVKRAKEELKVCLKEEK